MVVYDWCFVERNAAFGVYHLKRVLVLRQHFQLCHWPRCDTLDQRTNSRFLVCPVTKMRFMGRRVSAGMGGCGCVNLDTYIMVLLMPFSVLFACHTLQLKSAVVVAAGRLSDLLLCTLTPTVGLSKLCLSRLPLKLLLV